MLPNVIIVGVPKAGTTSVNRWLMDHPDVAGPIVKETEYFVDEDSHAYNPKSNVLHQGVAGYGKFFEHIESGSARVVLETAPDYMYQRVALSEVSRLSSQPKIIFLLREPAAQIYSLFHYLQNNHQYVPSAMTFSEFVGLSREQSPRLAHHELLQNAVHNAKYVIHIDRWIAQGCQDRVGVYLFEDLVRDSASFVKRVCRDWGLDPAFYDDYDFASSNETYEVRSHALHRVIVAIRQRLPAGAVYDAMRNIYRRFNTTSGGGEKSANDQATLNELRIEFGEYNRALAQRFDLDLSAW